MSWLAPKVRLASAPTSMLRLAMAAVAALAGEPALLLKLTWPTPSTSKIDFMPWFCGPEIVNTPPPPASASPEAMENGPEMVSDAPSLMEYPVLAATAREAEIV